MNASLRRRLLACALAAPAAWAPTIATAQTVTVLPVAPLAETGEAATGNRPVVAMGGSINLLANIRTFQGDIDPRIGNIRTFEGDLSPYIGNIRTFSGDLNPYIGNIRTFWGTLAPSLGEIDPKIGNIRTFSDGFGLASRDTLTYWANIRTFGEAPADYAVLQAKLADIVTQAQIAWGTQVLAKTGKTFQAGFVDPLFAKYGIDLKRPETLSGWDNFKKQQFLLEWYDNLTEYSGMDHIDGWMRQINWTPKLTQVQGGGVGTVIGLVDFYAAKDPDVVSKMVYSGGFTGVENAHGAAVLSLIVASHDGKGVMGISPMAKVAAYNPFDSSMTADWASVQKGITEVSKYGASVINLSLGVPGWTFNPEWRNTFKASAVDTLKDRTIYVIAAGNDGITQTANVEMNGALDSTFIIVGSVDPNNRISSFSNSPGTTCLTDGGKCDTKTDDLNKSGYLMNRFIVAPGELILVSDGKGGVTRMSGTSFAAPLVAGAIGLIHDRWPWLKKFPRDVAKAILGSAKDLGAPGIDPVYGVGLLDVEASQSALNFNDLKYYLYNGTAKTEVKVETLRRTGLQAVWQAKDMYFTAFEKLEDSDRDFLIPLSSRLVGTMRNGEYFQEFVYNRFAAWMNGGGGSSSQDGNNGGSGSTGGNGFGQAGGMGFTDSQRTPAVENMAGWSFGMRGRYVTQTTRQGMTRLGLNSSVEVQSPSRRVSVLFGQGDGALALGGQAGFQMTADFDSYSGGVNPLLGFASGGAHIASRFAMSDKVDVSFGTTQMRRNTLYDMRGIADQEDRIRIGQIDPYRSRATNVRVDIRPLRWLGVSASITRLDERGALFGVRSLDQRDFGDGTASDGVTLGTNAAIGSGVSLFGSATGSRSHSQNDDATFRIGRGGVMSSAFQVGASKVGLIGRRDELRLTLAQPLTVEKGSIDVAMVEVIDRETGEKGMVSRSFDISDQQRRRYVAEVNYGAPVLNGLAQVSLFGRSELRRVDSQTPAFMAGGQARLSF